MQALFAQLSLSNYIYKTQSDLHFHSRPTQLMGFPLENFRHFHHAAAVKHAQDKWDAYNLNLTTIVRQQRD